MSLKKKHNKPVRVSESDGVKVVEFSLSPIEKRLEKIERASLSEEKIQEKVAALEAKRLTEIRTHNAAKLAEMAKVKRIKERRAARAPVNNSIMQIDLGHKRRETTLLKAAPVAIPSDRPRHQMIFVSEDLLEHRRRAKTAPRIKGTQVDIKSGFIYVLTNPSWPDHVKIGSAIDYEERVETYQTGTPHRDYKLCHAQFFDDRRAGECAVHKALAANREGETEWFKVSLNNAIEAVFATKKNSPSVAEKSNAVGCKPIS